MPNNKAAMERHPLLCTQHTLPPHTTHAHTRLLSMKTQSGACLSRTGHWLQITLYTNPHSTTSSKRSRSQLHLDLGQVQSNNGFLQTLHAVPHRNAWDAQHATSVGWSSPSASQTMLPCMQSTTKPPHKPYHTTYGRQLVDLTNPTPTTAVGTGASGLVRRRPSARGGGAPRGWRAAAAQGQGRVCVCGNAAFHGPWVAPSKQTQGASCLFLNQVVTARTQVFLYIVNNRIVGCVIVERIDRARVATHLLQDAVRISYCSISY